MASRDSKGPYSLITTYKTVAIALAVALVAILLFVAGHNEALQSASGTTAIILTEIGGLLLVSAALTLLWELGAKREFANELFEKARISEFVRETGLIKAFDDFQKLDWDEHFEGTKNFDVYFAGGTGFRKSHQKFFEDLEDNPQATINVFLPDPDDEVIVEQLRLRWRPKYTEQKVRERLTDAIVDFNGVLERARAKGATVNVWLVPFAPLYTLYRCDDVFVFTPYRHRPYESKGTVPVSIYRQGGSMHEYFEKELAFLKENGRNAFAPGSTADSEVGS